MAITFPRDLPATRFRPGSLLRLERQVTAAPTRGGLVQVAELGTALWKVRYETPPMREVPGAAWEAWLASLRGGARQFKAVHPFRRTFIAYPGGYGGMTRHAGGSFDGTATLGAVATDLGSIRLDGLPSAFVVTPGDLLSFVPSGSRQALHRVVEGGTSSAGSITVTVEPTIKPGYTLNASVALASPWFKAVLDESSVSIAWAENRLATVGFEAWQVLS